MSDDLEPLFLAVSEQLPAGSDLEYDPEFARMEKAAQGTPDQEYGATRIEGESADWETVRDASFNLLSRTKDLRIATYYAQSKLILDGLRGFRDGMKVIAAFVDQFWDAVYPQLDPDDDNDPTIRINSLMSLSSLGGVIRYLRETPIVESRSVGRFSAMDWAIARGETPPPDGMNEVPTQKKIEAAVQSCVLKDLEELYKATQECLAHANSIENGFSDRLGAASGPNLELLIKELKGISKTQKTWLDQRRDSESGEDGSTPVASEKSVSDSAMTGDSLRLQMMGAASFAIGKREDAIEALDKIIRWFERYEPSSPLPMLLKRAKRLSAMSFLDILRDITPDGVGQAVVVGGAAIEETPPITVKKESTPSPASRPAPARNEEY